MQGVCCEFRRQAALPIGLVSKTIKVVDVLVSFTTNCNVCHRSSFHEIVVEFRGFPSCLEITKT